MTITTATVAHKILRAENMFIVSRKQVAKQNLCRLRFVILNLMPNKLDYEKKILRLIANTPLQVEINFLQTESYIAKNTSSLHLAEFYTSFAAIKQQQFDGLIITGAAVGKKDFDEVAYWPELTEIMEWSKTNVRSTLHICWGAYAGLSYHYAIPRRILSTKIFGIFEHEIKQPESKLLRGFDDFFWAPHSRYSTIQAEDVKFCPELQILAEASSAGIYLVASQDYRQIFLMGHPEYDALTLDAEYRRDLAAGISMKMPENYYPHNDMNLKPKFNWHGHANLLFSNWVNFCVYHKSLTKSTGIAC